MGDRQAEMPAARPGPRRSARLVAAATLSALLAGAALPASVLALVVTVGTPTASFGNNQSLSSCSSCTQFQLTAPGYTLTVPAAGRITTWRASGRGPLALRVLRPTPGGLVAVATSSPSTFGGLGVIPTNLAVLPGDQIGVNLLPVTAPTKATQLHFADLAGAAFAETLPAVPDGGPVSSGSQATGAISLNADVAIAPVATSLDVTSGSTAGGTAVTIAGTYLDGTTTVTFGGTPATFTLGPAGQLLVRTPVRGAVGPVDVAVSGPGGTSTLPGAFTYFAATTPIAGGGAGSHGPATTPVNPAGNGSILQIGSLSLAPSYFRAARSGPSLTTAAIGTRISYMLPLAATTTFTFQALVPGRLVRGRGGLGTYCQPAHQAVAPAAARCTRYAAVPGVLRHADRAGQNVLHFTGRLAGHTLAPGSYRLTALAVDTQGDRSNPATHAFRVLVPRR